MVYSCNSVIIVSVVIVILYYLYTYIICTYPNTSPSDALPSSKQGEIDWTTSRVHGEVPSTSRLIFTVFRMMCLTVLQNVQKNTQLS